MSKTNVMIIGGGAAGLTSAIAAARSGASVTVLEAKPRVGSKILATGNGRCNLTNKKITSAAYNDPHFVSPILSTYTPEEILSFFEGLGLLTYSDEEGRVYPLSNNASSVLDVLRLACECLNVETICDFQVEKISQQLGLKGFVAHSTAGEQHAADAVIVATGGGKTFLSGLGHHSRANEPVLAPIRTDTGPIRGLSGIRVRCEASIFDASGRNNKTVQNGISDAANDDNLRPVATQRGEILFRDYGVSGIMVFDLSRYLGEQQILSIDFMPDVNLEELTQKLCARCNEFSTRTAETFLTGMFHARVSTALLRAAHINSKTPALEIPCDKLARIIKNFELPVTGAGDSKQAQVMRGGISTKEFDPQTLESRLVSGLFAAGEVLDVDGRCGGFNLHWAWSSGLVAGENAAQCASKNGAPKGGNERD